MTSLPLDSTHGRTTSGVACDHRFWAAHTVERRRALHAIIALGRQTRSNDVRCDMPLSPLGSTHDRTTLGVAYHHRLWAAHMVERCQAWHDITAIGLHARSDVVGRDISSLPWDSTHGRTTSAVACHHRIWAAHTVERRQAWYAVITFWQHKRSNDVGRGMPSLPLGSMHSRMTLGVACHHRLWAAHTVEQRRAWHAVIAFGQHTRSNDVGRGIPSSPLGITNS